jgi:hypothetical protein
MVTTLEAATLTEREARIGAAERRIASSCAELRALKTKTDAVSQALLPSSSSLSQQLADGPSAAADVVAAAASVSALVRDLEAGLEELIVTAHAESLGQQCVVA